MFIVIEMADVELVGTHLYHSREKADIGFDQMEYENKIVGVPESEWGAVANGTVRLSGDDSYSLQMIEDTPLDRMPMSITVEGGVVQEVNSPIPIEYELVDNDEERIYPIPPE
jgi:hypothetical protein